jgi:protein-tyrosine phosphatase
VLLHCAAAHSRTPTVAARYGVLLGIPVQRSIDEVCAVLPEAHPNQALVAALRRLGEPGPTPT